MKYFEVKIYTTAAGIEAVSNILMMLGFNTFVTEDGTLVDELLNKENDYEWDYISKEVMDSKFVEPNITLYMEAEKAATDAIAGIADAVNKLKERDEDGIYGRLQIESRLASDDEWKDKWKEYFKPAKISENIIICPSWEHYEAKGGEHIIKIDPGMAFGTGTHATTKMCVLLLEKYIENDEESILDLGCGSGILSIAAAICGAKHIKGVDIDPNAIEASMENIEKNGFSGGIEIVCGDVTKGLGFKSDIIVANLMAELIVELLPDVVEHLKGRSIFICSGILSEKKTLVKDAIDANGLEVTDVLEEDGWCAIAAKLV